jgi:cytochrome c oxidase subunit 3
MREVHWSYESLRLPVSFWFSTLVLVAISVLLQRACWFVHRENQEKFRRCLMWAWALAVAFMFIQSFGLVELINRHFNLSDGAQVYDGSTKVYGMSFALALIHALHVVGGLGFLGFVIFQAFRGRYDHERHWAVDHCAGYWHFLDCVWVSMLIVFAVIK